MNTYPSNTPFKRSTSIMAAALALLACHPDSDDAFSDLNNPQTRSSSEPVLYEMPDAGEVEFTPYTIAAFPTMDAEEDSNLVVIAPPHHNLVVDLETDKWAPDLDQALDGAQITATLRDHRGTLTLGDGLPLPQGLSFPINGEALRGLPGGFYDLDIQVEDEPMLYEEGAVYVPLKMDLNLDGAFNDEDLVEAFIAGKYETGEPATWQEGDMNGDMKFDSEDFVVSVSDYTTDPAPPAPERHVDWKTAKITKYTCWLNLWKPRKRYYGQKVPTSTEMQMDIRNLEVSRTCSSGTEEWSGDGCGPVADLVFPDPATGGNATAECSHNDVPLEDQDDFHAGTATIEGQTSANAMVKMVCAPEFEKLTDETQDQEFDPNESCYYNLGVNLSGSITAKADGNLPEVELPLLLGQEFVGAGDGRTLIKAQSTALAEQELVMRYPSLADLHVKRASYPDVIDGKAEWPQALERTELTAFAQARNTACDASLLDHMTCDVGAALDLGAQGLPFRPHLECYMSLSGKTLKDLYACYADDYNASTTILLGDKTESKDGEPIVTRKLEDRHENAAFNPRNGVAMVNFGFISIESDFTAESESVGRAEIIAASKAEIKMGEDNRPKISIDIAVASSSLEDDPSQQACNVKIDKTWLPAFDLAPSKEGQYQRVQNGKHVELTLEEDRWFVSADKLYSTDDQCYDRHASASFATTWPLGQPPAWLPWHKRP